MNKQILEEQLQKLGLNEDEASLYLFLLENGPKTPLEISRESSINRSKVYRLIETMQAKKLIEEAKTAWGQKLQAAPPENLNLLIQDEEEKLKNKKDILETTINNLVALPSFSQTSFEIKHYKGVEGFKQMVWNEMKSQEILIFGYLSIHDYVGVKFAEKVRQEHVIRKQKIFEITNSSASGYTEVSEFRNKVIKIKNIALNILTIKQQIEINGNTVSVFNKLNNEFVGIEIINKQFADTYKQIFWHYWEIAK